MNEKYTPEDLNDPQKFEFLAEVSHSKLKEFVIDQILEEKYLIRHYSAYQLAMLAILLISLVKAVFLFSRDTPDPLIAMGWATLFSFTVLVIIHELLHAVAYFLTGSRKLAFGAIWKKFIFYVVADRQVISPKAFRIVALAPFVTVKVITLVLTIWYWPHPLSSFFLTIMCLHSLFCAGDIAMLAFYRLHPDKEIYNYDDVEKKVTYFYFRK